MPPRASHYSRAGTVIDNAVTGNGISKTALAAHLGESPSLLSQRMTGRKGTPPSWLDMVADVMQFSNEQRRDLHLNGAIDAGYRLDLTTKK